MDDFSKLEVFKIGRCRIMFPPDITEEEIKFLATVVYSYIQTVKFRGENPEVWLEGKREKNKTKEQAGIN